VALVQRLTVGILGGLTRSGPSNELLMAEGNTITEALFILNGGMSRRLDFRHLTVVLVGDELSREGLEPIVRELMRSPWARGSVVLSQARGEASGVLRAFKPVGELNPARASEGYYMQGKYLHLSPPIRLHHFIARMADPGGDPILAVEAVNPTVKPQPESVGSELRQSALSGQLPRNGGNPVDLAGYLTVDETQALLALRGEMGKVYTTVPDPADPSQFVTMRLHQENLPKYTATLAGAGPQITGRILLEGEVLAVPSLTNYTAPAARMRLEAATAKHVENTIGKLLEKLRGWEADPVGFGQYFRGRFASWPEWESYRWRSHVGDLGTRIQVVVRIRRYGLVTKVSQTSGSAD
jgi:hypothetical protein